MESTVTDRGRRQPSPCLEFDAENGRPIDSNRIGGRPLYDDISGGASVGAKGPTKTLSIQVDFSPPPGLRTFRASRPFQNPSFRRFSPPRGRRAIDCFDLPIGLTHSLTYHSPLTIPALPPSNWEIPTLQPSQKISGTRSRDYSWCLHSPAGRFSLSLSTPQSPTSPARQYTAHLFPPISTDPSIH